MKIEWELNDSKLYDDEGILFGYGEELLKHITEQLDFLESHNKNYTNKQYFAISQLKSIFKSISSNIKEV